MKLFHRSLLLAIALSVGNSARGDWNAAVSASNPLNWYRFDELSGSTAVDYGSQHLNGAYGVGALDAQRGVAGRVGGAAQFGNQSTVFLSATDLTGDWTAEFLLMRTGSNYSSAIIRNANFSGTISRGFVAAQLYSTASYQAHDLRGVSLAFNNLTGWNFAGQNLAGVDFSAANVTGANFTGAFIHGPYPFQSGPQGFTKEQLYSTASYQLRDLRGFALNPNVTGWNLSDQNLMGARFINIAGANFERADLRGASLPSGTPTTPPNFRNAIRADGSITGLALVSGEMFRVRNFDPAVVSAFGRTPSVPLPTKIVIKQAAQFSSDSRTELFFDERPWQSTITFTPGISVALGGTFELGFSSGVDPVAQLGRTFDLFDWAGVTPTGAFSVSSPYQWDLSQLYSTGEITLIGAGGIVLGDFSGDGVVNADDLAQWRAGFGGSTLGDADQDGDADGADFLAWQRQLGHVETPDAAASVPEPTTLFLLFSALVHVSASVRLESGTASRR